MKSAIFGLFILLTFSQTSFSQTEGKEDYSNFLSYSPFGSINGQYTFTYERKVSPVLGISMTGTAISSTRVVNYDRNYRSGVMIMPAANVYLNEDPDNSLYLSFFLRYKYLRRNFIDIPSTNLIDYSNVRTLNSTGFGISANWRSFITDALYMELSFAFRYNVLKNAVRYEKFPESSDFGGVEEDYTEVNDYYDINIEERLIMPRLAFAIGVNF